MFHKWEEGGRCGDYQADDEARCQFAYAAVDAGDSDAAHGADSSEVMLGELGRLKHRD